MAGGRDTPRRQAQAAVREVLGQSIMGLTEETGRVLARRIIDRLEDMFRRAYEENDAELPAAEAGFDMWWVGHE